MSATTQQVAEHRSTYRDGRSAGDKEDNANIATMPTLSSTPTGGATKPTQFRRPFTVNMEAILKILTNMSNLADVLSQ